MSKEKTNIIVFGASGSGESFISHVNKNDSKYNILAVADNDKKKHNTLFKGYLVIAPEEITKFEYDEIIITSAFFPQINTQLLNELKVTPDKIKMPPKSMTGNKKTYRPFSDDKTLRLARQALLFVVNMLEDENITYFIDHGTLLGVVRDGDLIPWDDDIDLSIEEKDMNRAIDIVKKNVLRMPMANVLKWNATVYYKEKDIPTKILLAYNDDNEEDYKIFPISIESFIFENGQAIQELSYSKDYHFKNNEYILYYEKEISVPYDYTKYLEIHYGDWEKPKKDTTFLDAKNYKVPNTLYKKDLLIE